jgi:hypothetical protein
MPVSSPSSRVSAEAVGLAGCGSAGWFRRRWAVRGAALVAGVSLVCCGGKDEGEEGSATKAPHSVREAAEGRVGEKSAAIEPAPSTVPTSPETQPEDREAASNWPAVSQALYSSSDEWRKCGNDITLAEQWFHFKGGIKGRIQEMGTSPAAAIIERKIVAEGLKGAGGTDFAAEFPGLASLSEDEARRFLDRWGKAAGLSPGFTGAVMATLGSGSASGSVEESSAAAYESAQAEVHPMVDSYYKGAVTNVLRMAEQEALIRSRASAEEVAARESYSAAQAERFAKPTSTP